MPTITLPNTFADTNTSDVAAVMENFYSPDAATPDSLEVINGWLDDANLASGEKIQHYHLMPGAVSVSGEVGSNATLDFFYNLFDMTNAREDGHAVADATGAFVPIPGACATFWLPFAPTVFLASWNISWTSDADNVDSPSIVRFVRDGVFDDVQRRIAPWTVYGNGTSVNYHPYHAQHWSGHSYQTNITAGWHSMGLYIANGGSCTQSRVRSRSFRYVAFR